MYDGLDVRLVNQVLNEFLTVVVNVFVSVVLISRFKYVEILHIDTISALYSAIKVVQK